MHEYIILILKEILNFRMRTDSIEYNWKWVYLFECKNISSISFLKMKTSWGPQGSDSYHTMVDSDKILVTDL